MLEDLLFKEHIRKLYKHNSIEYFYASTENCAKISINEIIKKSKQYIKIYCSDLIFLDKIYDNIVYKNKYLPINIVVKDNLNISNKYYQKNNEYNITLYLIDDNSKSILNKYNCHVNFIVSDDKMFLIETDTSNKKYIGNFNNEITTKHLTKKFNELLINY